MKLFFFKKKQKAYYNKGAIVRLATDFSIETIKSSRQYNIFKGLKNHNCQPLELDVVIPSKTVLQKMKVNCLEMPTVGKSFAAIKKRKS